MPSAIIPPPATERLLAPLLAALPAATVSKQPPGAILPFLSPILRQRVQLLSATAGEKDSWLPLLYYGKASKLEQVVSNDRLQPHPVSGEVEIDWQEEVELKYKRLDEETLQALAAIRDLQLGVRLVYCVGDQEGGGDGWRIGEVNVLDALERTGWDYDSIDGCEAAFESTSKQQNGSHAQIYNGINEYSRKKPNDYGEKVEEEEDDDGSYWAQYDNTPARTPAPKHSPAPHAQNGARNINNDYLSRFQPQPDPQDDEDEYYAQYSTVQAAMDNYDPNEAQQTRDVETSLGRDEVATELLQNLQSIPDPIPVPDTHSYDHVLPPYTNGQMNGYSREREDSPILQPRPASSTPSSGSDTVARLEQQAAASASGSSAEQSEMAIKQHISTSLKSLYRLAKVGGIDREEFDRLVRTELDLLSMMDD
ncbi:hypothetical protein F5884DRAFT_847121 [Xylogone sp. PMI_703]|nr:hypothetical protein F5884DRAFT_847121 [Xylogone sp. PMI_703]